MSIISLLVLIFTLLIGLILFMFIYWRALKDDYTSEKIFSSLIYLILGGILGGISFELISKNFETSNLLEPTGLWFWGALLGASIALILILVKFQLKFNEIINPLILGLLIFILTSHLGAYYYQNNIPLIYYTGAIIILIILYPLFENNYKKFRWYRSGRVGFTGLVLSGLYFIVRAVIALYFPNMISLAGKIDIIISIALAFLSFFALYNLSHTN